MYGIPCKNPINQPAYKNIIYDTLNNDFVGCGKFGNDYSFTKYIDHDNEIDFIQ